MVIDFHAFGFEDVDKMSSKDVGKIIKILNWKLYCSYLSMCLFSKCYIIK